MKREIQFKYPVIEDLVSIIIPTHNRQDLIRETLESATNQTYKDIEIIVVNDHSTDRTVDVVKEFIAEDHDNVRLLESDGYGGNRARNIGAQNSKGAYIQFFDDDDIMCPEFVSKRLEVLKEKKLDFVCCDFDHFLGTPDNVIYHRKISDTPHNIVAHIYRMNLPTQPFLIKRDAILKIGGWDERVKRLQDMAFFHRLFLYELKGDFITDVLYKYRIHDNTVTKKNDSSTQIFAYKVIAEEWKAEGKYNCVKDVVMVGIYRFLRQLKNENKIHFFKEVIQNLPVIITMQYYYRVAHKYDSDILHGNV